MSNIITNKIVYKLAVSTANNIYQQQERLRKINWTCGEANLDKEFSQLACECCVQSWNILTQNTPYQNIKINCVIPDINITFILPDNSTVFKKIELKSSTKSKIPGSTIKNLDINQPLIYCLRPINKNDIYQIKCSQYHHAMGINNTEMFQDRTPRPRINFDKMEPLDNFPQYQKKKKKAWVKHYANCALNRINKPENCNHSWQDDMIKEIKNKTIKEFIKNTSLTQFQNMKNLYD